MVTEITAFVDRAENRLGSDRRRRRQSIGIVTLPPRIVVDILIQSGILAISDTESSRVHILGYRPEVRAKLERFRKELIQAEMNLARPKNGNVENFKGGTK